MKNFQNGFVPLALLLIVAGVLIAGGAGYWYYQNQKPQLIGGQKDEHGCLGPAGYSWCEVKQKCLRVWEEGCTATSTTQTTNSRTADWKIYTNTAFGYEVKYPSDLNYHLVNSGNEESVLFNDTTQATGGSRSYAVFVANLPDTTASPKELISAGLEARKCNAANFETLINWAPISTGGIRGIEATSKSGDPCLQKYLPWAAFGKDNKVYYIQFLRGSMEEFNQILSTFTFTQ